LIAEGETKMKKLKIRTGIKAGKLATNHNQAR
jgi:hypothetical protein